MRLQQSVLQHDSAAAAKIASCHKGKHTERQRKRERERERERESINCAQSSQSTFKYIKASGARRKIHIHIYIRCTRNRDPVAAERRRKTRQGHEGGKESCGCSPASPNVAHATARAVVPLLAVDRRPRRRSSRYPHLREQIHVTEQAAVVVPLNHSRVDVEVITGSL